MPFYKSTDAVFVRTMYLVLLVKLFVKLPVLSNYVIPFIRCFTRLAA